MHERKILLVDNEPDVTYAIESVLEDNGFEVDSFNDPVLASVTYKQNYYDLILLDIKMPKMDGFDLYQEIKKIDSQVKICFLTASEMYYEEFRKEAYCSLDKDMFLRKPIENEDLLEKINMIIRSN